MGAVHMDRDAEDSLDDVAGNGGGIDARKGRRDSMIGDTAVSCSRWESSQL
jgi:hypothetical protein